LCLVLTGCASAPLVPFSTDTAPLILVPAAQAGVQDKRGRFREIYCGVLAARVGEVPDHRPCDEAMTRLGAEPAGTGQPVPLGASSRHLVAAVVPGIGYSCFAHWLQPQGTADEHLRKYGYALTAIPVDALSGTTVNARQIRDWVMARDPGAGAPRLVLVGYSKGTPDVLEAIVNHPEIRARVAAVVSIAGAVGGSPLANEAEQYQADVLQHFPGAACDGGDGGGVASLRPAVRRAWLAQNPLPSSVIFYDQLIPGSTLVGYLNADHWAVVVPIARAHGTVGSLFVTQNAYPREALIEAVLRFVEEDLAALGK
jgi:dienelactone hydrolase